LAEEVAVKEVVTVKVAHPCSYPSYLAEVKAEQAVLEIMVAVNCCLNRECQRDLQQVPPVSAVAAL